MIYKVTLNGKLYQVEVEKGEAIMLDVSAAPAAAAAPAAPPLAVTPDATSSAPPAVAPAGGEVISAPLPGTVLDLKVTQGQAVVKGQLLLVIEAMKMENEILSPRDGTVLQVVCEKGGSVNTGSPLIVLT